MNKNKITKPIVNTVGAKSIFARNENNSNKHIANIVGAGPVSARNSKGITLVALIITIIIMLILVGVSISIAINGGLFDTAKKAAKETENAKNLEQQLANGRVKIGETWYDSIEDYMNEKPSANQEEGGGDAPVTPPEEPDTSIKAYDDTVKDTNGVLTANATYTSDGKTAVVPKGFKIVNGIEGTKSIADGLVIQDKDGNEFVWIPVEVTESDTETNIASFYRSEWENNARTEGLDTTRYTEPYTSGYTGEVAEYNAMLKSVYKNKGFYIGRYEAGSVTERTDKANGTTEMVVKKNQYPYNYVGWGASMTDYTSDVVWDSKNQGKGAVRLSREMYKNKDVGVTSSLCYGVQWDAMLDYIKDQKNVTDSTTWGNYDSGNVENTGSTDTYSAKNIYDVAGNVGEWNMEAHSSTYRVIRGGNYSSDGSSYPASYRNFGTPDYCYDYFGFRTALYIK